jgi:hypothetical protein
MEYFNPALIIKDYRLELLEVPVKTLSCSSLMKKYLFLSTRDSKPSYILSRFFKAQIIIF